MLALMLATVIGCGDLCSAAAMDHYEELLASGGYGRFSIERAAFVIRERDGGLTMQRWASAAYRRASFRGSIPPGTIAIAHTHPLRSPGPSEHDRVEARRLGLPVIVVTPGGNVAAFPDGTIRKLSAR